MPVSVPLLGRCGQHQRDAHRLIDDVHPHEEPADPEEMEEFHVYWLCHVPQLSRIQVVEAGSKERTESSPERQGKYIIS